MNETARLAETRKSIVEAVETKVGGDLWVDTAHNTANEDSGPLRPPPRTRRPRAGAPPGSGRHRPRRALRIHGQLRDPVDERLGNTRLVANPAGYRYEAKNVGRRFPVSAISPLASRVPWRTRSCADSRMWFPRAEGMTAPEIADALDTALPRRTLQYP